MAFEDQEIINEFVVESTEHLADVENQFLTIEENGANIDVELVNEVFRAVHSIKGAAGFMGFTTVNSLAHSLENVLNLMREEKLTPTSPIVDVMLKAADKLNGLISTVTESNGVDVSEHVTLLDSIADGTFGDGATPAEESTDSPAAAATEVASAETPSKPTEAPANEAPAAPVAPASAAPVQPSAPEPQPVATQQPAPAKPAPAAKPKTKSEEAASVSSAPKTTAESSIRVSVETLDHLMNLAGELVLGRNQLMQTIGSGEKTGLESVAARINQVTCEMQDAIMQARMQPIGNVFNRFSRVVRDLSAKLGKQCDLTIEGKDVEVDKTIVEAIADPLTHLVRNAVDHGLETPADRVNAGKNATGKLLLRALHQSGKVCIEIKDDGAGIDPQKILNKAIEKGLITSEQGSQMSDRDIYRLIFAPGFSTAEKISDVSGRGVGMDVVRTNIERLGGTVEVESRLGSGSTILVTLPLTLAIIPSLIVHSHKQRFAIPQVNIVELVRIRRNEVEQKIGRVKGAEVLRLRGSLLPLVRLSEAFGVYESKDETEESSSGGALNIIVVETGQVRYGLIVDGLFDSEEIVVKPLGRHLKDCRCLSGATILGDGRVALILDVSGVANQVDLSNASESSQATDKGADDHDDDAGDTQSLLLFSNHEDEQFALPMSIVSRIERVRSDQIDSVGNQLVLQYRGASLPLLALEQQITAKPRTALERLFIVVFEINGKEIGLIAPILHDIRQITAVIDDVTLKQRGVMGSMVLDDKATRLLDIYELVKISHSDWLIPREEKKKGEAIQKPHRILLAEDSKFFRNQVKKFLLEAGHEVVEAADGQIGWDTLIADPDAIDLVVTDIQMPRMDGLELCQTIRGNAATKHLPVIALTSLAGEEDIKRGQDVGVDDYQVKMDREKLLRSVDELLSKGVSSRGGSPTGSRKQLATV